MNSKNMVPIKSDKISSTCMHCLKEYDREKMHIIHIPPMGYGSGFDGFDTIVVLCDDCYNETIKKCPDMWKLKIVPYTVTYKKNDHLSEEEREKGKVEVDVKEEYIVPIDMQHDVIYTEDFTETWDKYEYEDEIFDFFRSLPLQGQELIYNRLDKGHFSRGGHNPQEWIDYYLGELSDERCKANMWHPCKK